MTNKNISVLIPVHHAEDPRNLNTALDSIFKQTHNPFEVLIVKDETAESPRLDQIIEEREEENIRVKKIREKHTLGYALQQGLEECASPIIARMDSDDIAKPTRFEEQIEFLENNPDIDVVGSYIAEFVDNPDTPHSVREVPTQPDEMKNKAQFRCPMNHPSVMYWKESVLKNEGYRDISSIEDYDLWARMITNGAELANIPKILMKVRADETLYQRRGGLTYAYKEYQLQKRFLQMGLVSYPIFLINIISRTSVRMLPNNIRKMFYSIFLRE